MTWWNRLTALTPNPKITSLLVIVLLLWFLPAESWANSASSLGINTGAAQSPLQGFGQFASVFINIFTFLSLLILSLIGDLLGTDFITGPEAMAALLPIWQYVRNMVNILAVLMIVYLSFSNLVSNLTGDGGGGTWSWQIKDKLPKIIFTLVAINFSMLGFRLVIDAVHMGSIAIFSIADTQLESNSAESIDRILTGKKWRRVMQDPYDIQSAMLPNGSDYKYVKYDRNDFSEKLEDKTCTEAENAKNPTEGQKVWMQARFFNEDSKFYEANEDNVLVCGSFTEQINSTFCAEGTSDDDCFFALKSDFSFRNQQLKPGNNTAQNLFMAFGVMFMRIEQLPSLAANIDNLFQVIDNTLFSALMAIMYVIALSALFFVLVVRILILWLAIAFSPVVIGLSIMGIDTPGSGLTEKVVTHLIVPIKIAAAFAISFVMMSSMIEFKPAGRVGMFEFGPALSAIAIDEYAIMWQIATIIIFWKAATWALEGTEADAIVKGIMSSAETVGEYALKASTIESQIFSVKGQDGKDYDLSLQGLLDTPKKIASIKMQELENADNEFYQSFYEDRSLKSMSRMATIVSKTKEDFSKNMQSQMSSIGLDEFNKDTQKAYSTLNSMADRIENKDDRTYVKSQLEKYKDRIIAGAMRDPEEAARITNQLSNNRTAFTAKDFESTYTDKETKTEAEKAKEEQQVKVKYESKAKPDDEIKIAFEGKTHNEEELKETLKLKVDEVRSGDNAASQTEALGFVNKITGETEDTGTNRKGTREFFEAIKTKTPQQVWNDVIIPQSSSLHPAIKKMFKFILFDVAQKEFDTDKDKKLNATEKAKYEAFVKALEADRALTADELKGNFTATPTTPTTANDAPVVADPPVPVE